MNTRTALIGAALVIVAVALLIVLSDGEGDDGETITRGNAIGNEANGEGKAGKGTEGREKRRPKALTIVVDQNGEPVGGVAELSLEKGDEVRFEVKSAVADEIHVHGYDLTKDVEAGGTVSFAFPAEIEGIFEAELEERAEQILELRVEP